MKFSVAYKIQLCWKYTTDKFQQQSFPIYAYICLLTPVLSIPQLALALLVFLTIGEEEKNKHGKKKKKNNLRKKKKQNKNNDKKKTTNNLLHTVFAILAT